MLLILGIVAIVVFTFQVYKTAAGTERNPALWAALTAAIGITFQFVIPLVVGIILAVVYLAGGTPVEQLQSEVFGLAIVSNLLFLFLSFVGMWLVMRHVSKVKYTSPAASGPPPPPTFRENF